MPLMDRFREQAAQLAQKTQEAALEGRAKLDQAQSLHDGGKHAESLAKANEALADLGVKK